MMPAKHQSGTIFNQVLKICDTIFVVILSVPPFCLFGFSCGGDYRVKGASEWMTTPTCGSSWKPVPRKRSGSLSGGTRISSTPVLLRFYRKASHQEVATALGTSEDGARMRVDRALDKLRRFFAKKSVALSATALAGALTANAAQAAPAGVTALAGAGGPLTTTSTKVLAKGAIQMMFIAQLKTAALITAACVVVAGSGVIVAKEGLTPSVAPVSAQAEQKSPPLATVTNVAATIAWGAVTNELQAGLVPLGSDAATDWIAFSCPTCASRSIRKNMPIACKLCGVKDAAMWADPICLSCAAQRRICTGCGTAKLWSATFVEGEPMRMELHFKNVGKEACSLLGAREGESWCFTFTPIGGGTPWVMYFTRESLRRLKTIEEETVRLASEGQDAVEHDLAQGWSFVDPQSRQPPNRALPVGKYTVTASYAHPDHAQRKICTYWHGTVTTGPVEIEIKPAVRVSHKLTGAGRNTRLSVTVTNRGTTPLELNKNVSTDAIRALRFFDADGERVPTIPPSFPTEGTITVSPGESREFDYGLNIFSPPLKAGHYSIHVSFISADPIQWIIPEQGSEGDAVNRAP
jgi:hypothetical protein